MPKRTVLKLKPRTAEERKRFDALLDRESSKAMLNAVERILAAGQGRPLPPKYVPKLDEDSSD